MHSVSAGHNTCAPTSREPQADPGLASTHQVDSDCSQLEIESVLSQTSIGTECMHAHLPGQPIGFSILGHGVHSHAVTIGLTVLSQRHMCKVNWDGNDFPFKKFTVSWHMHLSSRILCGSGAANLLL